MPLRCPRFSGDPVLEECFAGRHRMLFGEDGLPVKRVQRALIDLGFSIPDGDTGFFGPQTQAVVTDYKQRKGLSPSDPVVGPGTAKALDDDFFVDPPELDPTFAEFSPLVVNHRVEPFVALELAQLITAPFDTWRRVLGNWVLANLNSGSLLGIVAQSRAIDLRPAFLQAADPIQGDQSAEDFFDNQIILGTALGRTIPFGAGLNTNSFIVLKDSVILGRDSIEGPGGHRAKVTLLGVLAHELTHARNLPGIHSLDLTADTDGNAYHDTALAQASSATGHSTAQVMRDFVHEMIARHLHWIVLQESGGADGTTAVQGLDRDELASAAFFYFVEATGLFDPNNANGYIAGIIARGDDAIYHQLQLWLELAAAMSFSEDFTQDQASTAVFNAAAQDFADRRAALPTISAFLEDNGVFPRRADFI